MRIRSERVYINEQLVPAVIEIEESIIKAILPYTSDYDFDYKDAMILPGFIEIHSHGYAGHNANRITHEGLQVWANSLISEGVTSILATTATQGYDDNIKTLKTISDYIKQPYDHGAQFIGINVEGNFIDHQYRGAQDELYIVVPNVDIFNDYYAASQGLIKSVICAVEHDADYAFTKAVSDLNVAVSVGHSNATLAEVKAAISYGLKGATHTGNGMRPFHHREPGVFGASINQEALYAEVIVDGHHLHFDTVNIIARLKGKDKLILVTDSSSYKDFEGKEAGYERFIGPDNTIRDASGNLSGSNLRFNEGVYNAINKANVEFTTAINAATINPATYLNIHEHKGLIKPFYDADIIIVNDKFEVLEMVVAGKKQGQPI